MWEAARLPLGPDTFPAGSPIALAALARTRGALRGSHRSTNAAGGAGPGADHGA